MAIEVKIPRIYENYPVGMIPHGRLLKREFKMDVSKFQNGNPADVVDFTFTPVATDPGSAADNAIALNAIGTKLSEYIVAMNTNTLQLKLAGLLPVIGSDLVLTVEDEDGDPVEDARVSLLEWNYNKNLLVYFTEVAKGVTDASGEVTFEGLYPTYPYNFIVTKDGYEDYNFHLEEDDEIQSDNDDETITETAVLVAIAEEE